MCMTSWKSYTHNYVQFKAKCQDIYVPEFMITASDQTFPVNLSFDRILHALLKYTIIVKI